MKIAYLNRRDNPISAKIYQRNIISELMGMGVDLIPFSEDEILHDHIRLIWDPGLGMIRVPKIFKRIDVPLVCTIHGLRAFSLPIKEITTSWRGWCRLSIDKLLVSYDWKWFIKKVSAIIAVSQYGSQEAVRALRVNRSMVHTIYHGVDRNVFCESGERNNSKRRPYLLHVSTYHPIKNVDRIVAAYLKMPEQGRPDLVLVLPGFKGRMYYNNSIRVLRKDLSPTQLAGWYRGALGFLFPSLRETFGLPILEAMACGCPVLTSHDTGCEEIAGDAALLVNPYSIEDLGRAMNRLAHDNRLRQDLRQKGLARVRKFSWQKSAKKHLEVFSNSVERFCQN